MPKRKTQLNNLRIVKEAKPPEMTRGEINIAWIEHRLKVPEGKHVGRPIKLRAWQREAILDIYDNPHGTRRGILSFGRKNGKTALAAMLVLLHLCGPESLNAINSQLYSAAQSRDQAALVFSLAAKMVRMDEVLSHHVTVRDSRKELYCRVRGTVYRALSAETTTAFGLSPKFIVHDELGQVRGPKSTLYEALETAVAAQSNPLSIIISTQAPNDNDLLSILIDDALAGNDKRTVLKLYAAPKDADPFAAETIKKANPAFADFQDGKEVLSMAEDARRMPSRENEFRNLVLNQRVEAQTPFVSRSVWDECGAPVLPFDPDEPLYGGLDLSAVSDLTAFVMIGRSKGIWQVVPTFWLPQEGLMERTRLDRVPYDIWARDGFLNTVPGKSIEYEYVATYIAQQMELYTFKHIAFDRWNWKSFRPWLLHAGVSESTADRIFKEAGQNFQWMSPALRQFESALLNKKVAHGKHPILTMCAMNSVVVADPAGNRKLAKNKSTGRIDGMVALAMALGSTAEDIEREPTYQFMVV